MQRMSTSVLIAPVVLAVLFGSALIGLDRIAFRDVSHFYTPLYDFVAERQQESWLPLWNDLEHTGIPLAGETTTAVLYPIRIAVYQLPFASETTIAWYIWIHLCIAALSAWIVSRWYGTSRLAASFAAITYSLSGAVFFLHNNLPFLVSAAWLPLAIGTTLCPPARSVSNRTVLLSMSLAMMILGGDPQAALHCVMILFGICIVRTIRGNSHGMCFRQLFSGALLASLMAAPQLAASTDWSLQSDRAGRKEPFRKIIQSPKSESPRREAFAFSIPPWHLTELVSPQPFGQLYPVNTRMSLRFFDEARMWVPTLYMGFFVGLSLLSLKDRWNRKKLDRWWLLAVLAMAASLGSYGALWFVQFITGAFKQFDGSVGGIYWCLYWLVPGYDAFRYPAKWLPFFAIGVSIATAKMMDHPSSVERVRRLLLPALLTFALMTLAAWLMNLSQTIISKPIQAWIPKDPFWGPLQIRLAWQNTTTSLLHSSVAAASLITVFWLNLKYKWSHRRLQLAILLVLIVDLSIAVNQHLLKLSRGEEYAILDVADRAIIGQSSRQDLTNTRWLRTRSGTGWPRSWQETSSPDRALEVEAGGQLNWFGRWHLKDRASVFNSATSIRSAAISSFWKATRSLTEKQTPEENAELWQQVQHWLSIDGVIATKSEPLEVTTDSGRYVLPGVSLQINSKNVKHNSPLTHPRSQLRIVSNWIPMKACEPTEELLRFRLQQILQIDCEPPVDLQQEIGKFANENLPWFLTETVMSPKLDQSMLGSISGVKSGTTDGKLTNGQTHWRCIHADPENTIFELRTESPALVARPIYQDGHWKAQYRTKGSPTWKNVEVGQIDFLKQGVVLPAGSHELRFTYQPWWLNASLIATIIGCAIFVKLIWEGRQENQPLSLNSLTDAKSTKNPIE